MVAGATLTVSLAAVLLVDRRIVALVAYPAPIRDDTSLDLPPGTLPPLITGRELRHRLHELLPSVLGTPTDLTDR